jgi:hypothetical protein
VGDVVLLERFASDPEAQAAAALLRDAGLHPVVLGRDPLAQLVEPFRAVRLLVPAEEREAARELLGSLAADAPAPDGPLRAEQWSAGSGPRKLRSLGLAGACGVLLLAPLVAPAPLRAPLLVAVAGLALLLLAGMRRRG